MEQKGINKPWDGIIYGTQQSIEHLNLQFSMLQQDLANAKTNESRHIFLELMRLVSDLIEEERAYLSEILIKQDCWLQDEILRKSKTAPEPRKAPVNETFYGDAGERSLRHEST